MLSRVLGSFGSLIGNMFGGGVISTALKFAGRYIGNYISQSAFNPEISHSFSHHLDDISSKATNLPYIIPIIFGKARISARIIWSLDLKERADTGTKIRRFKDSHFAKSEHHHTDYSYFADFALMLAEGEISELGRVWINGKEYDISPYNYRFYNGNEEQIPDPLIEMHEAPSPAFRGLSYIVFENFPLAEFGNKIPCFEFELTRLPKNSISDLVKNICIIPGSGEFVYDTELVEKIYLSEIGREVTYKEYINCHNSKKIADSLYNLESLEKNFRNLEYVSLVVTWFVDNLEAGLANIYPAIEDRKINSSVKWQVAGFTRENARIISKDQDQNPNYGGTVNDISLLRYLSELKKRNIKIVFNPMIFLDVPGKPWRGHITGNGEGIRLFFQKYKKFILHYAYLTKDYIDAFLIGSELKGLTGVKEDHGYPAIEELVILAAEVRSILGARVKISYSADWSEYHHLDGYYNLDKLWASKYIDFIGIDGYFPLTNSTSSAIGIEEIKNGLEAGEGFDYYLSNGEKKPLDAAWAWKNLKYWWENEHYNEDGSKSPWIPKQKKIWFTEFGFPSIDKSTNQPNVFYDPNCTDGGIPKYSTGEVDFDIQRKAIRAFLEYWQDSPMVEKSFLWAWDARPQPAWPHMKIWRDSNLWLKGHWVNDKLCAYNLSDIIKELCIRSGFKEEEIIVSSISENIEGLILNQDTSSLDTILMLQALYFFDIRTNAKGQIEFISRKDNGIKKIDNKDLIKNEKIFEINKATINNYPSHIRLSYLSYALNYLADYAEIFDERKSHKEVVDLNIPILMNMQNARFLGRRIINSRKYENRQFKFILPYFYMQQVGVGDVISLEYQNQKYNIRISSIKYENYKCFIEGNST